MTESSTHHAFNTRTSEIIFTGSFDACVRAIDRKRTEEKSNFTAAELRDRIQKQVMKPTAAWIETPVACYLTGQAIEKAETKESAERKIITSPIFPPINVRGLDWCATYDGYEPGCPIGHGATEQEAIQDLKDQAEPDWKQLTPQEELEDARTEARLDLQAEREDQESHYYSLRDEGRNDDGTGMSYGERNL